MYMYICIYTFLNVYIHKLNYVCVCIYIYMFMYIHGPRSSCFTTYSLWESGHIGTRFFNYVLAREAGGKYRTVLQTLHACMGLRVSRMRFSMYQGLIVRFLHVALDTPGHLRALRLGGLSEHLMPRMLVLLGLRDL